MNPAIEAVLTLGVLLAVGAGFAALGWALWLFPPIGRASERLLGGTSAEYDRERFGTADDE